MRKATQLACLLFFTFLITHTVLAQTTIFSYGDSWKYLDNGTNQKTNWRTTTFNDGNWKTGIAKFGYGISDAQTIINYGPNAKKKYITTYFRKSIIIDLSGFISFSASVKRDDGVVVYINGSEVFRNNMPKGNISYNTLASDAKDNGNTAQNFSINASAFKSGANIIAVEIHQQSTSTPDMAFDMELIGNPAPKDITPPVATSINRQNPLTELTNASTLIFKVTFSEKVTGVDTTDFFIVASTVSGLITDVIASGTDSTTFNVTINYVSGNGTIRLDLNSSGTNITDVAGNLLNSGYSNGQSYTIDQTVPTVENIALYMPETTNTNATSVIFRTTFSEAVKGVDISDFAATIVSGSLSAAVSSVSATSANIYDVTISSITGNGELRLDVLSNGITDLASNKTTTDYTTGPSYVIEQSNDTSIVETIVPFHSSWKYLDDGSDQGTAWQLLSFNDENWKTGNGKFGYGISDATTIVSYGNNANNKYITTYFRKAVNISDASKFTYYNANVNRDDGVIIYVNGTEVFRNNMPVGAVSYTTLAPAGTGSDDGATPIPFTIPATAFTSGTNLIAVEIHQYSVSSSDIAFDLELIGKNGTPTPVPAEILYYEGFESGTGFSGMTMQTSTTYGFTVASTPTFADNKVGRWELHAGDPPVANGTRTEVLFSASLAQEETWHSYAGYFPADDYLIDAHSEIFNQWHQGISGTPMLTFTTINDHFIFKKRGFGTLPTIDYDLGVIPKDQWVEFVIHIKQHLTDGLVQIWINGDLKLDIHGDATMFEGPYGRWKMGIYKSLWNDGGTTKRVWYVDEVKIGNATSTYSFMKPFGNNITTLQRQSSIAYTKEITEQNYTNESSFVIYPTIAKRGSIVHISVNKIQPEKVILTDITGRTISIIKIANKASIETANLPAGIYFINLIDQKLYHKRKFILTN